MDTTSELELLVSSMDLAASLATAVHVAIPAEGYRRIDG